MASIQAVYEQTARAESKRASGERRPVNSGGRGLIVGAALAVVAMIAALLAMSAAVAPPAGALADHDVISAEGAGDAMLGSTKAQLEAQLGAGWELIEDNGVLVDLYGYDVQEDGEHRFFALGGFGEVKMSVFVIDTDHYQLAEGVHAGMSIADAEAIYGEATLNWNPDNESREFVTFESGPEGRIFFRTFSGDFDFAGIYPDPETTMTTEYKDDARISSIWVTCVPDLDCPELAITGARETVTLTMTAITMVLVGFGLIGVSRRRTPAVVQVG